MRRRSHFTRGRTPQSSRNISKRGTERDCSSRISVEHTFSGTPYFEGTIAAFEELINKLLAKEEDSELSEIKTDLLNREKTLAEYFHA